MELVGKFGFWIDRNPLRIKRTSQFYWIFTVCDIGDLSGGEGNNFILFIPAKEDVKIVEIPPACSHDYNSSLHGKKY